MGGSTVTGVDGVSVIPLDMVVVPGDGSDTPDTSARHYRHHKRR